MKILLKSVLVIATLVTIVVLVVYRDQLPQHGTMELPDGTYTGQLFRMAPSGYGVFLPVAHEILLHTAVAGETACIMDAEF